jgi:hypothetical protein
MSKFLTAMAGSILSVGLSIPPAYAFICEYAEEKTNVVFHSVDRSYGGSLNTCPRDFYDRLGLPITITIDSEGGYANAIYTVIQELQKIVDLTTLKSGTIPKVVVKNECSSACVAILTKLNQMAKAGLISLEIDPNLQIGLHGGWMRTVRHDGTFTHIYQF